MHACMHTHMNTEKQARMHECTNVLQYLPYLPTYLPIYVPRPRYTDTYIQAGRQTDMHTHT